jgi:mycofactocin system FadH/OYE family oxidoreductase 2
VAGRLERLFSPLEVGRTTLRNRIVSPPHGTSFAEGGLPSERQAAYYEARARGGVGLIVVGSMHVLPAQSHGGSENLAEDQRAIPGYRRIADAVHRHGAHICGQLHFSGRQLSSLGHRQALLAASPLQSPQAREIPKEMELEDIEDLIEHFGLSATNVIAGGFDGVEVFSSQGYGLNQFLSPASNHREDEWGGSLENRMRILLRIVERVRTAVGPEPLVGVRLSMDDLVDGGLTLDDSKQIAAALEATGTVDYLNGSASSSKDWPLWIGDMSVEQGIFVPIAAEFRSATGLPLAIATRIKHPEHAEAILAEGNVDLIGMNRALIADPDLPRKAQAGRFAAIRPCINSNQGCLSRLFAGYDLSCTVNPVVGHEREYSDLPPATARRRVAVVGGGPAGMQSALVAAQRGHAVTLFEERDGTGGQLQLATRASARRELGEILGWLDRGLAEHGVEVRLGTRADAAAVADYDAVVLATGSVPDRSGFASFRPSVLAVPGNDLSHVFSAWEAIEDVHRVGEHAVVFEDDPHVQATTVAEFLAEQGRRVTLVTRNQHVGESIGFAVLEFLYKRLYRAGVELVVCTWVDEILTGEVRCSNVYTGSPSVISADAVVLCTGNKARAELYHEMRALSAPPELHRVGDCLAPRKLDNAMWDGYQVGRAL